MRLIIVLSLLILSSLASAEIYKWVDANGEVHYQDHPRGTTEKFSTSEQAGNADVQKPAKPVDNHKLLQDMQKARKQREKSRQQAQRAARKQAQKCIKYRDQTVKMQARLNKQYSEFSNDRPPAYALQMKKLQQRKKYLETYCD